jgi:hypothetical protein
VDELVEIRCPLLRKKYKNSDNIELCNRLLIAGVKPGSAGRAYCDRCKQNVDFDVKR